MADNHTPLKLSATPQHKPEEPSTVRKAPEAEPMPARAPEIKAVEPKKEKEISPEVIDYIKKHEEKVKIPEVLKDIGVTAGKDETLEVVEGPTMPLTDQQIADGLQQPMSSSKRWLAQLFLYWLQQAHYTIKVVKGHVTRVVKP